MVKGTVINLDFFPRGRSAVADHFNPVNFSFLEVYFTKFIIFSTKLGGPAPPPGPSPCAVPAAAAVPKTITKQNIGK